MLLTVTAYADSMLVDRIEITGNDKTLPTTILQELFFSVGDMVTDETLEESEQAVQDLGLFQKVTIEKTVNPDGSIVANVDVVEKRYTFILPKLDRNGEGDITTGIVWRSDNLFGRNQVSKFTLAYRTYNDTDENDETSIRWDYFYPRIRSSPYSLTINLAEEDTNLDETLGFSKGTYDRDRQFARFLVGRWLNSQGPSRGLRAGIGPSWEKYSHEFISGAEGLLPNLTIQALVAELDGYYVRDHLLSRSGHHYRYELAWSNESTGSDIDFVEHRMFFRKYHRLAAVAHSNLNFQFSLSTTNQSRLGPPEYKIGGSRLLRGYDRDEVEGNSFLILNTEWLRPVFDRESLRSAVFADVGNAWDSLSDASFSDLKYSTGLGLRWKLKRFVKTDVRLDIAYGLSDGGTTKAYLGTRSTF
jgi:outer membrane protein assembly factor BamA